MAEKPSLRRSLRTRSLEGRPSPYISPEKVPETDDGDDDDDGGNNNFNQSANKEKMDESIQPNRRVLRKRKVSSKKSETVVKEGSSTEKMECDSVEHLQKILSDKWYVDYYDNDTESVFDVKKCCLCPGKFFTNFALKKHFDSEHKKNKFNCQRCSDTFPNAGELKCHERRTHPVRLMPSAMFHSPEIQEVLRKCIKQEEDEEMSITQPKNQQFKCLSEELQAELQKQSVPPELTRTENMEPQSETQPQKIKTAQTEQLFKIPSQNYQRIITPLKNQLQNVQISCQTKQDNFPTQLQIFDSQPIIRRALKRKHSFQNSPPKNQNLQAPSRKRRLHIEEPLISKQETPPLAPRSLDRRQNVLNLNYCDICKKQFSNKYLKIHMESVHELVRHECESCNKTYSTKSELRRHIRFDHWGEKFECSLCPQIYRKRSMLRTHIQSSHSIHQH